MKRHRIRNIRLLAVYLIGGIIASTFLFIAFMNISWNNWMIYLCLVTALLIMGAGAIYIVYDRMHRKIISFTRQLEASIAEQKQRETEMNMACRIQQRFLPRPVKLPACIDLVAELHQSREVGGDLYDFFLLDRHLYFAIGDVSGKGIPAALYMTSMSKLFHYVAQNHASTAEICTILNNQMCDSQDDIYATLFIGILNLDTGVLTYTNAGHTYPLCFRSEPHIDFIEQYPDVPVGILEDYSFNEYTHTLDKGCSLLFYTDGITDAEDPSGSFYGKERLIACVEACTHKASKKIILTIMDEINTHISTRRQSDDLTLLLIKYNGADA